MKTILNSLRPWWSAVLPPVGLAWVAATAACDTTAPTVENVGLNVVALSGTACGDSGTPTPPPTLDSSTKVAIAVRGFDPAAGSWDTLVTARQKLGSGAPLRLRHVPEGVGRDVIVTASQGDATWYGRDAGLTITRNTDTDAAMVLSRLDGFSCVPTPEGLVNTTFSSAVALGDGRILVTGGFTDVVTDENGTRLAAPTDQAFLFNPRTGERELLPGLGADEARAGHTAVFFPSHNRVVIFGGMTALRLDTTLPFPFVYDAATTLNDYVVFDVATKTFTSGVEPMRAPRAFPRAALLADGTALITGGGTWPFDPAGGNDAQADIYDPEEADGAGGLLDIPPMRSFYWRAGHSLTPIEQVGGLSTLLIWGGTTPDRSLGHPAEIFRQSGRQRDGVNGTFVEADIVGEAPPFSYFHETTPLSGRRFLVTGGVRYASGRLQAPVEDEAWLLTYDGAARPRIHAKRVSGLGAGRVFHSALSSDGQTVSVVGGWAPVDAAANPVMSFNVGTLAWTAQARAAAASAPRGGQAAILTTAGTLLLVGGEASATTAPGSARLIAEIYTPATMPQP